MANECKKKGYSKPLAFKKQRGIKPSTFELYTYSEDIFYMQAYRAMLLSVCSGMNLSWLDLAGALGFGLVLFATNFNVSSLKRFKLILLLENLVALSMHMCFSSSFDHYY